ncbi:MAG: spore coat U domain-containing protein [Proteobacteria bacterium]|nr:spore coat U domain-containing protein [Pseudomonadota bacterium]
MRRVLIATAVGAALLGTGSAFAATTTTTFQVQAAVQKACQVNATALNFGNYTPGSGAASGTSTINVLCTKTTGFTVALNGGSTTGGTVAQRLMANGTNTLQYNLFTTNTYATVWGDNSGTSVTQAGTGNGLGTPVAYTVYGQLLDNPTNQNAVPGNYTDTITVTVTY